MLSQKEFDLVSIRSIIQLLDTHQIDHATVKKLQKLGFVESAKFLNRHFDLNLENCTIKKLETTELQKKIIGLSEAPFELVNKN